MSVFQRVIRGVDERDEAQEAGRARLFERANGHGNGHANGRASSSVIEVDEFEYVRVQDTALARLAGTGRGDAWRETPELTLVALSNGRREEIAALPAAAEDEGPTAEARPWRVAFSLDVELAESPDTTFTLLSPAGETPLPRPSLRDFDRTPLRPLEPTPEVAEREIEDARRVVREADAGRQWIQAQLSRERDRRRELEEEVAQARAEIAKLKPVEAAIPRIEFERERREELESQVADLTAQLEEADLLPIVRRQLVEEQERTQALEAQMAELAIDRERLSVLDERVADAARQVEAARADAAAAAAERDGLREQLQHARAEAEATAARLGAELEAARAVRQEAVAEPPIVDELRGELAGVQAELGRERERSHALDAQITELRLVSERVTTLGEQVEALAGALESAREEARSAAAERDVLHRELQQARADAAQVSAEAGQARADAEAARGEAEQARAEAQAAAVREVEEIAVVEAGPETGADSVERPIHEEPTTGSVPCAACEATGSCSKCAGKGKRLGIRCAECGGSGLCHTCGGPGFVWQ